MNRRSDVEEDVPFSPYYHPENLGVCRKAQPLPSHMCRLSFVHECKMAGEISNECPSDKNSCCFDGCINRCVGVEQNTFLSEPSNSGLGKNFKDRPIKETTTGANFPGSGLNVEASDLISNVHGALYNFFMGEY